MAYDFPDAPVGGQIVTAAGQRFEYNGTLLRWEYIGVAGMNGGGGGVTAPGTIIWGDPATTLTSTGCVQLSLDNVSWSQSVAVSTGTTFYTRWDPGATCDGAPHGTTVTGTVVDATGGTSQSFSKTIDKTPSSLNLSSSTVSTAPITVTPSVSFTVSGTNSSTFLWGGLTTTSGGVAPSAAQYSLDNVTYSALPIAAGSVILNEGDTVYVRFTTGDTSGTSDTLTVKVGENETNKASATYTASVAKAAFPGTAPTIPTSADTITTSCTTWNSGANTIYATGCLEFSVNGGAFTQANTAIADGQTLCTRWKDGTGVGTTCADAVHGTTIVGTIESAANSSSASLLLDRQPNAFNFTDQTNIALSTQVTSNTVTIAGTNTEAYLQWTPDATNPLTTVQASINGGAYVTVPAAGTYTLVVPIGATITVRGTTGAAAATGYTGTFTLGDSVANTTDTWTVTTSAGTPSITAPTITAPTDGSTGIAVSPTVTTSAYTPLNGAGTHACTDWQIYEWIGAPGGETAPTTEPPAAANYSSVVSVTCDATNLTSYTASLSQNKTYYARAQYKSSDAIPVLSGFGPWSEFATGGPTAGDAYEGGYYVGQIVLKAGQYDYETSTTLAADKTYNLVVAPRATGQYGGAAATPIEYKTSFTPEATPAISQLLNDGRYITETYNDANHPAFQWAASLSIGGYSDWYIPARDELEMLYRAFKPGTTANNTGTRLAFNGPAADSSTDDPNTQHGVNLNSSPTGSAYTAGSPAQTTLTAFQTGGSEALSEVNYWSATEHTSTSSALRMYFLDGDQLTNVKTATHAARAVRRVPA